jgi:N6-adenosine-specific RNA methylase IME4
MLLGEMRGIRQVTSAHLPDGLRVLEAWGFKYRTTLVWVKERVGMGDLFRLQHELLLVGVHGDVPMPSPPTRPSSVITAPRRGHSEKPEELYTIIESMFPDLPRVELFARRRRPGWDAWGNQLGILGGEARVGLKSDR